ncbi:oligosaccharide flippase family protein [Caballeronia insecticola]|uniref:Oligosaccharide translocase n=1 Tax=Caballeronia insecticola TaxID=758793 RepID=R4WN06_9BURK|nr:oligosaccharide flippase family protein [Caballeronia insecticola]BAN26023.1 oligosaccharide translocase [Caballeronia insecticola]
MASFRKNFAILMTMQISTYLVPLLTLPWLARVLSPSGYGQLSFGLAFLSYFVIATNYSFSLTATPQISVNRHDRAARSRIFWETIFAQTLITVAGFAILLALTFVFPVLGENRTLLLLGFGLVIGTMLIPTWYFQGMEDLGLISTLVFIGRALSIPAMFLLVREPGDIYWAMSVNSMVSLVTGAAVLVYLLTRREIDFVWIPFASIVRELKNGWSVFMATAIVEIYASSNIVLLALMAGNVAAGYFAAGDKLIRAALNILSPLKTAAYPRISFLMHHSRGDAFAFLRVMFMVQGSIVLTTSLVIFFGAPLAVQLLYGAQFQPTIDVLRWMAFVPFMAGLSDLFGVQTMLPLGMKAQFTRILIGSALLNFLLLAILANLFGAQGAAATVLAVESAIAVSMAMTLYMRGVPFLRKTALQ